MTFARGYRTYLIAAIGVGMGVYDALVPYMHLPAIPGIVFVILGFLGLSAGRAAISNSTQAAAEAVLNQITVAQAMAPAQAAAPVTVNVTNAPSTPESPSPEATHFATHKGG
jgi:hypothetical protein